MRRFLSFLKLFRSDLIVLLTALRHRDTPRRIKAMLGLAVVYLVSPIDIIPDTVPLAGILDDMVIVPAAVCGLTNMLPSHVRREAEMKAERIARYMPLLMIGASLFILLWVGLFVYGAYCLLAYIVG